MLHLRLHLRLHSKVHLWLYLSCASIAVVVALINGQKCTNNSSSDGSDTALEGTPHGALNVALEVAP